MGIVALLDMIDAPALYRSMRANARTAGMPGMIGVTVRTNHYLNGEMCVCALGRLDIFRLGVWETIAVKHQ